MDKERARLRKLEEEARDRRSRALAQRSRPSDMAERHALKRGYEEWRQLMQSHGWTDEQLDEEEQWTVMVNRRCDEAAFDSLDVIRDMIHFVKSRNLPLCEQKDAFDDYPGPRPYWGTGGVG